MKTRAFLLFNVLVLMSLSVFGSSLAAGPGVTLGIGNGLYAGTGKLVSATPLVPNLNFESMRRLHDGVIQARTQAKLMGMPVAEASARLRVRMKDGTRFDLLDLENNGAVCGSGFCGEGFCSFSAKVMSGGLELNETWVADGRGFRIVSGAQNFKGLRSRYQGRFVLQ